nr:hypothetical protein [Tanacetum cinerariifolium]
HDNDVISEDTSVEQGGETVQMLIMQDVRTPSRVLPVELNS